MYQMGGIAINNSRGTDTSSSKALILGRKEELGDLCRLLEKSYDQVTLAETLQDLDNNERGKEPVKLAVMTDSFPETLTLGLLNRVRQRFAPENMICLSNEIDPENEIHLRSAGLIFLGSYGNFFAHADNIIGHTLVNSGKNRRVADTNSVLELEKRLTGRTSTGRIRRKRMALLISTAAAETIVRTIELSVAIAVTLLLFTPVLLALLVTRLPSGKSIFSRRKIYGVTSTPLTVLRFKDLSGRIADLPLFLELFTGRLALAGTALREWGSATPSLEQAYISMVKPGIISLWDIRKASKIAHEGREAIEWEYIFKKRPLYDLLMLLRALPVMLYSEKNAAPSPVFELLGLDIDNITMDEAVSIMQTTLRQKKQCSIYFVNPDCLNKTISDPDYRAVLKSGDHIFPDGIGLIIAGKLLQSPLKENINGTDMLPFLCRMAASEGHSIFLLGGKPGIAELAAAAISRDFGVHIAGTADGYFNHQTESGRIIDTINRSGASILLVAFGAPLQEIWIDRYREHLRPGILLGVGGLFDFYSGNIRRAPRWIREIGFEWVYRIMQEPGRMWRRYVVGNPLFLYRVMKWKLFTWSSKR